MRVGRNVRMKGRQKEYKDMVLGDDVLNVMNPGHVLNFVIKFIHINIDYYYGCKLMIVQTNMGCSCKKNYFENYDILGQADPRRHKRTKKV